MVGRTSLLALLVFGMFGQVQEQENGFHGYAQKFGDLVYEFFLVNRHFISRDTLRVLTGFTPFYIASRAADHDLHRCFYDEDTHSNKDQPSKHCHHFIEEEGGIIPIALLSSAMFWSKNERLRTVSRIYLWGALSVFFAKNVIKNTFEVECAMRPLNADFPKQRVFGGFPSGHAAIFSYTALYWGLEYGPKAFIPLALYGAGATWLLLHCNRHFASQLVGGIALGAAYGIAAHKVAQWRWSEQLEITVNKDSKGRTMAGLSYAF